MRPRSAFRLGIASLTSDYRNRIAIVGLQDERVLVEDDDYGDYPDFVTLVEAQHGYPATRLQWQPATANSFAWSQKAASAELLATTGDALRVWEYASDGPAAGSAYVGRQSGGGGHRLTLKTALSGVSALRFADVFVLSPSIGSRILGEVVFVVRGTVVGRSGLMYALFLSPPLVHSHDTTRNPLFRVHWKGIELPSVSCGVS